MAGQHSSQDIDAQCYQEVLREHEAALRAEQTRANRDWPFSVPYKFRSTDIPLVITSLAVVGVLLQLKFHWLNIVSAWFSRLL